MRTVAFVFCLCFYLWCAPGVALAQGGLDQRVSELSQQIATKMSAKQKTTIAVVEFTDLQGNVTDFGRFLAEELITRLYDAEKFKVIERQLLSKIIAEQKLSLTGVIDPASAKQLGKLLGVDAIVSGTITNLAQSIKVNARLISTETGEIFAVASAEIFKDESVTGLLAGTSGSSVPIKPTAAPSSGKIQARVKDFVFEVNACKMGSDAITCYLTVKNDSPDDRLIKIFAGTNHYGTIRLIDDSGREYIAASVRVGAYSGTYEVSNRLVALVPTIIAFKFQDVSTQPSKATLSIGFLGWLSSDRSGTELHLTLRNIPITK